MKTFIAAIVACVLAGAGCGSSTLQISQSSNTCTYQATAFQETVQVQVTNYDCGQFLQGLSEDGLNWYPIANLAGLPQLCQLHSAASVLTVLDQSGDFALGYGTSTCSNMEQNGWTP